MDEVNNGSEDSFLQTNGIDILHNIQSSKNAHKLWRPEDPIAFATECKASEGKRCKKKDDDADFHISDYDNMVSAQGSTDVDIPQEYSGNYKVIQNRGK